jgi:hypothetical protein
MSQIVFIFRVLWFATYELLNVLDFLMGYEPYLRKGRISVSSRHYKPTGKHRNLLR